MEKLQLNNTGIDDEGAEILASSLKHNTNLYSLKLVHNNNITKIGRRAFLKLLINISSIESTYNSNNTLYELNLDNSMDGSFIQSALEMNGKAKVIKYQLNSQKRKKLCRLQGVEYSAEDNMLADIEPKLLPTILALIGRKNGQSEFYTSLLPVAPDLMSFIDRKVILKDRRDKIEVKRAALTSEYERKLALLNAEENDINNRLALIELGDSKQAVVNDEGKEGGRSGNG